MEREQERSTRAARPRKERNNQHPAEPNTGEVRDDMTRSSIQHETVDDATLLHQSIVRNGGPHPRPDAGGAPAASDALSASDAPAATPYTPPISPEPGRSAMADPNSTTFQDLTPPPPLWQRAAPASPAGQPMQRAQQPAQPLTPHVPWQAAETWGPTTLSIEANTAAGASYLLLFITGLLVYFNERNNRYVRFHAMQSILLTGVITVFGVVMSILSALCSDIATNTHLSVFEVLGVGIAVMAVVAILCAWLGMMIAAWTGHDLHLPLLGAYAERYAAPPVQPPAPPFY